MGISKLCILLASGFSMLVCESFAERMMGTCLPIKSLFEVLSSLGYDGISPRILYFKGSNKTKVISKEFSITYRLHAA